MDPLLESKTAEAAHTAAVAKQAEMSAMNENLTTVVRDAVRHEMSPEKGRYIDVSRVKLICQAVIGIDEKLREIKAEMVSQQEFWPVKTLVYGITGLLLSGVIGALMVMVVTK